MKEDDIEDLFKKSFKDYEPEVKPSVWKNIRVWLKWGGLAFFFNTILNKIGISTVVAVISSIAIIGTAVVLNRNNKSADNTNDSKTEIIKTSTSIEHPTITETSNTENKNAAIDNEIKASDNKTNTALEATNTIAASTKKDDKKSGPSTEVSNEPIAVITASINSGNIPLIVDFSNTGTGKICKWAFTDGKNTSAESSPVHVFEAPGIYSVILTSTNAKGKTAVDTLKVEAKGSATAPKDFSPNGDGKLDVFVFKSKNIASMNAKVYDKNGTLVYKSEGKDAGWDGKDTQGKEAKEGIYFYSISAQGVNGKKYDQTGSIKLAR
jgi:gliding motility-associated-like protein